MNIIIRFNSYDTFGYLYRNKVTMMNNAEFQSSSKGKGDDISDQVILDFYNLATGRLLTGLEVSLQE